MYSIYGDWSQDYEKWSFIGQQAYNKAHEKDADFDEANEMGMPMMNYAYPLKHDIDEPTILKIVENTNCTVVENNDTGKQYLALTGGGMDLSQDIALTYIYAQSFVEWDLIDDVFISSPLSVDGDKYLLILKDLKERYLIRQAIDEEKLKEIEAKLKEYSKVKV